MTFKNANYWSNKQHWAWAINQITEKRPLFERKYITNTRFRTSIFC